MPPLRDFPTSEWLLHFSDVIGASHSADYRVWQKGGIASKGLEQVKVDIDDDGDDNDKEGDDDGAQ